MSEPVVTEADRERARDVILAGDGDPESWTQILAAALAAERAKAREPFVSLLTLCDAVGRSDHPHAAAYAAVTSDIRRAAEESL